jgi:hypothetical protein
MPPSYYLVLSSTLHSLHPSSSHRNLDLIEEEPGSGKQCNVMGMVEMSMSFCPSFSVISVMDSQEDKHNDESESLQCTMVIDTCYDRESNPQATIGELCIKPTNKNQ